MHAGSTPKQTGRRMDQPIEARRGLGARERLSWRRAIGAVATGAAALVVAACGSSSQTAGSPSSASTSATSTASTSAAGSAVAGAAADLSKYAAVPTFTPPGPAFDVKKLAGKTIFNVQESCTNAFVVLTEQAEAQAARAAHIHWINYCTQDLPSQWQAGVDEAISRKVNLINLNANADPRTLQPQLAAAQKAGIKVVSSHLYPLGYPKPPNVNALVGVDFQRAARLDADFALVATHGKPNVLVVESKEILPIPGMVVAIQSEIHRYCPSCKVTVVDVPSADWATKLQGAVQSALLQQPDINYIIPVFDPMAEFAVPGVTASGKANSVKIATYAGTPFAMKDIATGNVVTMDVGESADWDGWGAMDQMLRVLAGVPPVKNENLPLRAFSKSNIADAGSPPVANKGYGDAYRAGYLKLWGLG